MKIATIFGTRPEIIRLSVIISRLDQLCDHTLVHTGQNYDPNLSDVFFTELGVRPADEYWGVKSDSFAGQIAAILQGAGEFLESLRPDRVLILGDTNSGLAAMIAARMQIPVYHMEAGNRCYDDRVPEEVNRRVIDHCSEVLMPYTHRSKENLVREGIERHRIYVTGNPIKQVIDQYRPQIEASDVIGRLGLEPKRFVLTTMHRAENVDDEKRLRSLVDALSLVHDAHSFPIVCSLHPRTRSRIEGFCVDIDRAGLRFLEPLGFFDFVRLEQEAWCILTDSGTVQEEACLFGRPNVTIRDVTERPETLEAGSNMLGGAQAEDVLQAVGTVTSDPSVWSVPVEYVVPNVAETVRRLILGYRVPDLSEQAWLQT